MGDVSTSTMISVENRQPFSDSLNHVLCSITDGCGMLTFILSKNEETNIERCLAALQEINAHVVVLDSGSTDRTLDIASAFGVTVERYPYVNHCKAYNDITSRLDATQWCLILDADMIVSPNLASEVSTKIRSHEAVCAPVSMVYGGQTLRYASLYPPKPIAFRGGKAYFVPAGHGEKLMEGINVGMTDAKLIHDDRKPFMGFLTNQARYAEEFIARAKRDNISIKDRIRRKTPLGLILVPLIILLGRRGILDGTAGLLYAMDRLIAEAIKYRRALVEQLEEPTTKE